MTENTNLIEPEALHQQLDAPGLVILDCSWYLPGQNRVARDEYEIAHIPGARFFDIDAISDQDTDLPHMIPASSFFVNKVEELGISNTSQIVVYDGTGLFSAARVWWMFHLFGHKQISILNGGLPAWIERGYRTTAGNTPVMKGHFTANLDTSMVAYMEDIQGNCDTHEFMILDARSEARFNGQAPEPRPELPSGHMPGAISLPFTELLDGNRMKSADRLHEIFNRLGVSKSSPVVTSCGSGITAAIITLALKNSGYGMQRLFDGSWTEWALDPDNPIEKHG